MLTENEIWQLWCIYARQAYQQAIKMVELALDETGEYEKAGKLYDATCAKVELLEDMLKSLKDGVKQ